MPLSLTSLHIIFLLCFLRVYNIGLIQAQSFSPLPGFELPEIDGSAVDDICRIVVVSTSDATPATKPATTTSPITRKQVMITTKKPAVQPLPPRKPATKAPIRTQPVAGGAIPASHSNPTLSLLYYLLANSRRGVAASQPIGGYRAASSSDESAAVWKIGSFSSEDSSDES